MISTAVMSNAFRRNVDIIKLQAAGLTQADSLIQLPFRANCMNWVVGHILTNRLSVFRLLEVEDNPFDAASLERYQREAEPISADGEGALPLEQLLTMLEQAQTRLAERLETISPEELARSLAFLGSRSMPVAEWLFFFYFHDCYHTGQTEILRQAAGTDDKII